VLGAAYDVFCYDNSGTPTFEMTEWANATVTISNATPAVVTWNSHGMTSGQQISFTTTGSLPTGVSASTVYWVTVVDTNTFKLSTSPSNYNAGTFVATSSGGSGTHTGHNPQARQTGLALQDGVLVKSSDATRRYLGSVYSVGTSTTEDSVKCLGIWNLCNQVQRSLYCYDTTSTWTYTTNSYRVANASNTLGTGFVNIMVGWQMSSVTARNLCSCANSSGFRQATGIGINAPGANSAQVQTPVSSLASNTYGSANSLYNGNPAIGLNSIYRLEISQASGTSTWTGSDSNITGQKSGMEVQIWG
jgi:hypothetical protein